MKKCNITVNGPIGSGKTTLIENLKNRLLKDTSSVLVQPEPSVTIPFINEILKKFYNDNASWSYPLQLCISAAQESFMQTLRETEYNYSLFDAAFSSDIYGYSHSKHKRMKLSDFHSLLSIGRPFKFDILIWINEDKENIINHVKSRNKKVEEGDMDPDKKDVAVDDFSYLDSHIEDFNEYFPSYLNRFKAYNPNIKIIELKHIPDLGTREYSDLIEKLYMEIKEASQNKYGLFDDEELINFDNGLTFFKTKDEYFLRDNEENLFKMSLVKTIPGDIAREWDEDSIVDGLVDGFIIENFDAMTSNKNGDILYFKVIEKELKN